MTMVRRAPSRAPTPPVACAAVASTFPPPHPGLPAGRLAKGRLRGLPRLFAAATRTSPWNPVSAGQLYGVRPV